MKPRIVYFSSVSGNTHHFVGKLDAQLSRIPISPKTPMAVMTEPFVLFTPTYAANDGRGAVPKQVIKFLNNPVHRKNIVGVIGGGNKNFGESYGLAAKIISDKCNVPVLYRFELRGTPRDLSIVQEGLDKLWKTHYCKKRILA